MNNQAFDLLKTSLDEIRQDLREARADLAEQKSVLIRNTITLEDHVMRTNLLQEQVANTQKMVELFEKKMIHVDKHVTKVEGLLESLRPTPKKIGIAISAITAVLSTFTSVREFVIKVLSGFLR